MMEGSEDNSVAGQEVEETITVQMQDGGQLIIQQQEASVEPTSEASVMYQIINQQMLPDDQVQLTLSDGVNIIQTVMSQEQLANLETAGVGIQTEEQQQPMELDQSPMTQVINQPETLIQTDSTATSQSVDVLDMLNSPATATGSLVGAPDASSGENVYGSVVTEVPKSTPEAIEVEPATSSSVSLTPTAETVNFEVKVTEEPKVISNPDVTQSKASEENLITTDSEVNRTPVPGPGSVTLTLNTKVKKEKKPDLSRPIEVTDHMEIVVKGTKCVLKVNQETGQLCAYPIIVPGKKRGRPRRSDTKLSRPRAIATLPPRPPDHIDSAAEGLLELSNTGPDGIRRSARRNRGKPRTLTDYEVFEVSSDDDAVVDDGEDEVLPSGAVRRRKIPIQKEYVPPTPLHAPGVVKRGRGRPRRYPRPDDPQPTTNQIPAMIIPSSDGQSIMMAPIQGVTNLEEFQDQLKNLAFPPPGTQAIEDGTQFLNLSGLVDSTGDGNMVNLKLEGLTSNLTGASSTTDPSNTDPTVPVSSQSTDAATVVGIPGLSNVLTTPKMETAIIGQDSIVAGTSVDGAGGGVAGDDDDVVADGEMEDESLLEDKDPSTADDDLSSLTDPPGTIAGITGNDALLTDSSGSKSDPSALSDLTNTEDVSAMITKPETGQPTIIRIPENLLPMFTQKKEPVVLGLRASDLQLEKLKCQECGFQAYYEQQYQDHIVTHTESTHKCKCCKFAAFSKDILIEHFKKNHPRCICEYCDHMAEHAYIIKRHLMRHTQEGCTCEVCGKVYKDQYVLKMHVKLVHMPAEILFECNICGKKFTRKAHLKRHLRIHEPEKPFKCPEPQCNYRGCEKSDISKHLLIHMDPKHSCTVCNKQFRHMKNYDLHMKRHSGQRDYKCGVCDFYGYTFTDIRKHIERKHTDSKTFLCNKCGSVFRSEVAYIEHRSQMCDSMMIEQALSIATTDGGTTQATIQIPSHFTLDVDGRAVSVDAQGQIAVTNPAALGGGEGMITLTEEQIQAVASGQLTEDDLQALVNHGTLPASLTDGQASQGQTTVIAGSSAGGVGVQSDGEMIGDIGNEDRPTPVQMIYKSIPDDTAVQPDLVYKTGVDVALAQEEEIMVPMTEEEGGSTTMDEEEMTGIVSDTEDKSGIMAIIMT